MTHQLKLNNCAGCMPKRSLLSRCPSYLQQFGCKLFGLFTCAAWHLNCVINLATRKCSLYQLIWTSIRRNLHRKCLECTQVVLHSAPLSFFQPSVYISKRFFLIYHILFFLGRWVFPCTPFGGRRDMEFVSFVTQKHNTHRRSSSCK